MMRTAVDSLRLQAYRQIKSDLLMGVYAPGEQLPVDQLADKYAVSKTPVREALNLLQAEGLVEIIPRVGYFTARITLRDIQDMFELRLILESAAARLAARRIAGDDLQDLERMHGTYTSGDAASYLQWLQYNREFHHRIAQASGNRELAEAVGRVLDRLQRGQWLSLEDSPEISLDEHRRLVEALRHHDATAAEDIVARSIVRARDRALKRIMERPEGWEV